MDGNSDVHAKAIRETAAAPAPAHHLRLLPGMPHARGQALAERGARAGTSRDLEARIAEYDILVPKAREAASTRHDRMPYRIFLAQVAERLRTDLRRPAEPLRVGGPVRARHPARRLEPARQPRPARGPVPGRAAAVPRADLRLPSRDARRAPARLPCIARSSPQGLGREDWAALTARGPQRCAVRVDLARPRSGRRLRRGRPAHARGLRGDACRRATVTASAQSATTS